MQTAIRVILILLTLGIVTTVQAADRFIDNSDGTVTDTEQHLMWAAVDNNGDIDWHQALKWVRYTFPFTLPVSYDNWRLPTLAELQSLAKDYKGEGYEADCGQRVKLTPLIRLSCGWVWSSDSEKIAPSAYVFNFNKVYHYSVRKAHRRGYRALAVRNIDQ